MIYYQFITFSLKKGSSYFKKKLENESHLANFFDAYSVYITDSAHSRTKILITNVASPPPLRVETDSLLGFIPFDSSGTHAKLIVVR